MDEARVITKVSASPWRDQGADEVNWASVQMLSSYVELMATST